MMIQDYAPELNNAIELKKKGYSFDMYEHHVQDHMAPSEAQVIWSLAEYAMDKIAEEVNKETAELNKMLGEKDRKLVKQKEMLNKYYGSLAGDTDDEISSQIIDRVIFRVEGSNTEYEAISESKMKGLEVSIQKNQTLGNWFIITDLDTGSRGVHRLKDIVSWKELRYPRANSEPKDEFDKEKSFDWMFGHEKKFDPDKRVEPSITEICGYSDAKYNGEYHGDEPDPSNYGDNGGGF